MPKPIRIRFEVGEQVVEIRIKDKEVQVQTAGVREHSPDFRSVLWDGSRYKLTGMQAAVVKALWEAWDRGTPDVSQAALLEAADSSCDRLRDVFRSSPSWGRLVIQGETKGAYRLNAGSAE